MNNDVQYFYIDSEEQGQRLDNYLLKKLKGVPKSFIYKIIRGGEVRVNKKRAKPLLKLNEGDAVRVPPVRTRDAQKIPPNPTLNKGGKIGTQKEQWDWLENQILYEDDAYLILNKPAGVAVHGGSGISLGVIEMLHRIRLECRTLELGHRLDKETSGCLVIAKKRSFLRHFHELLREKKVEKEYWAILSGTWQGKKIRDVNAPLLKNILQSGERIVKVCDEGKSAKTSFELIENFQNACLVRARPLTGRTHQIRVHALHMGYPIIGDEKYGKDEINQVMSEKGCPRLCLHAHSLKFSLSNDSKVSYEASIDKKMQAFLNGLRRGVL